MVLCPGEHRKALCCGFRWTTDNRTELLACIEGLKTLKRRSSVLLHSDFQYVVSGMTKGWAERCQARNWKLPNGQDVKNADLSEQLIELCQQHDVEFRWVRGHGGNPDNERCSQLAIAAAQRQGFAADAVHDAAR